MRDCANHQFNTQNVAYYPGLTLAERALISQYPKDAIKVFSAKQDAEKLTKKVFLRDAVNDESDAFRHFVWASLLTIRLGEKTARKFLNAHEEDPTQKEQEKEIDLKNNETGIDAAKILIRENKISLKNVKQKALDALKNNRLKFIRRRCS